MYFAGNPALAKTQSKTVSKSKSSPVKSSAPVKTDPYHGWIPDIRGLKPASFESLESELQSVPGEDGASCKASVSKNLRAVLFSHYRHVVHFLNQNGKKPDEDFAKKWAHLTGMILKESSGDSTNVTDMSSNEKSTFEALTSLSRWRSIHSFEGITYNTQTNFGLAQLSSDRLRIPFSLGSWIQGAVDFLTGKKDEKTQEKARKLVWLYQDFARGRWEQDQTWIRERDKDRPENQERLREGVRRALWHCGTRFLFKESRGGPSGQKALEEAMKSISYCSIGSWTAGYGNSKSTRQCFEKWVTLCPNLNIDIALLAPLSYFETRAADAKCEKTYLSLLE